VLFHDTKAQTAAMIPAFLRELKRQGYRVVHVVPDRPQAAALTR
jgi:peptidoglycan-N-acetylglucosamine deacetylase